MRPIVVVYGIVVVGAVGLFFWGRHQAEVASKVDPDVFVEPESHYVSEEMITQADAKIDDPAPEFEAISHEGQRLSLADLTADGPSVIIFIKDGCPCSTSAEPYFQSVHDVYGERARFVGVIDGDVDIAQRWVDEHETPFPVLTDPDLEIIQAFEATNSAYVAVIDRDGQIVKIFPGYSAEMLVELGMRLAELTGLDEEVLDVRDAPLTYYSGCPFYDPGGDEVRASDSDEETT